MAYISDFQHLHKLAQEASVPYTWRDASSWSLLAELIRRNPEPLQVFECPYAGGMPHTVWHLNSAGTEQEPTGRNLLLINNSGSVTNLNHDVISHFCDLQPSNFGVPRLLDCADDNHLEHNHEDDPDPNDEPDFRLDSLDMIFSTNPKQLVMELESCYLGKALPERAPRTRNETIGARMIASALNLFLHSGRPLRVKGFLFDGVERRTDLLQAFPHNDALAQAQTDPSNNALDQLFFVCERGQDEMDNPFDPEPGQPLFAIDLATGSVHTNMSTKNLMAGYNLYNRDINALAFSLVKDARLGYRK